MNPLKDKLKQYMLVCGRPKHAINFGEILVG